MAQAQVFSDRLSGRVTDAMIHKAHQCKFLGGAKNFGFAIDDDMNYIPDSKTAPIVKEIFDRYAKGETAISIMNDLNSRGIKTALDRTWKKVLFSIC